MKVYKKRNTFFHVCITVAFRFGKGKEGKDHDDPTSPHVSEKELSVYSWILPADF